MTNSEYWKKRFALLSILQMNKGEKYVENVENQFKIAQKHIENKINTWYNRITDNNNITFQDSKRLLQANELKEFHWEVNDYIKKCEESRVNQLWIKELENASAKVHISRYEAIKLQLQQEQELLYVNLLDGLDKTLEDVYTNGYYRTIFEIQKGNEIGSNFNKINKTKIEQVLNTPWTADGKTFSDKLWSQRQKDINDLTTLLTQGIIRGDSPKETIKAIQKRFNVSKNQAKRLVLTETAFFSSSSTLASYKETGVKKYEILATLDKRTSNICQGLDKKVFDIKDYKIGITAPPFHPYCRTTTCPYIDEAKNVSIQEERAARDEVTGKTYYVDSNLTYPQWEEKYLNNNDNKVVVIENTINKDIVNNNTQKDNLLIVPKVKGNFGFRIYNDKEIQQLSQRAYDLTTKYVKNKSKWSGIIEILNDNIEFDGGKEWNCNISTKRETALHILLHEHLHACSCSYFSPNDYYNYMKIEEATVELLAEEICKKEKIEVLDTQYNNFVKSLIKLNSIISKNNNIFNFAKDLFNISMIKRLDWLESNLEYSLENNNLSLDEAIEASEIIDSLRGEFRDYD